MSVIFITKGLSSYRFSAQVAEMLENATNAVNRCVMPVQGIPENRNSCLRNTRSVCRIGTLTRLLNLHNMKHQIFNMNYLTPKAVGREPKVPINRFYDLSLSQVESYHLCLSSETLTVWQLMITALFLICSNNVLQSSYFHRLEQVNSSQVIDYSRDEFLGYAWISITRKNPDFVVWQAIYTNGRYCSYVFF